MIKKKLVHTSWGIQSNIFLEIYKALILFKLDYGIPLFLSVNSSLLKVLEPIYYTGIRLSIGVFHSRPIQSILTIVGIPFLAAWWNEQIYKLAARIPRLLQNITSHPKYTFHNVHTKYNLNNIITNKISLFSHQLFAMNISFNLHTLPKNKTCLNTFNNQFKVVYLSQKRTHIYTDAFLTESNVGMAIIYEENLIQWKLYEQCSMYTSEAMAIFKAIE